MSKDHVRMHMEYPPRLAISDLVKRLKGRSSRLLQKEYPKSRERYWGKHMRGIGYGAWSAGNITDEIIQEYLKHHRGMINGSDHKIMLE